MKRTITIAVAVLAILFAMPAELHADCPCVPVTKLWTVKTCDSWDCAQAELLLASGNTRVFAVPFADGDSRWIVLSLVNSGSQITDDTEPMIVEPFDGMDGAMDHYRTIAIGRHPMIVSAPDGKALVLSLRQVAPQRRIVRSR